jgi:hypothetical protein
MATMARQMVSVPAGWSLADYRRHNDGLAAKYGEPPVTADKHLAQARQHLKRHDERSDWSARDSELHAAVTSLLQAVEQGRAGR